MPEYMIVYYRFPAACSEKLYGACLKSGGRYVVMIDNSRDEATQANTLKHELAHLFYKHLEQEETKTEEEYQAMEREADEYADKMTGEEFEYLLSFCTGKKVIPDGKMDAFDLEYKPA